MELLSLVFFCEKISKSIFQCWSHLVGAASDARADSHLTNWAFKHCTLDKKHLVWFHSFSKDIGPACLFNITHTSLPLALLKFSSMAGRQILSEKFKISVLHFSPRKGKAVWLNHSSQHICIQLLNP